MASPVLGESFAWRLRRHREAAGLTQEELAERAGLTAKAISALERGERRRPYPQTVRALAAALGLTDGERSALVQAIQTRGDPATGGADPADLRPVDRDIPVAATPLLGRDAELAVLRDQLLAPEVRLLTLVGPGGVGKTRLAAAVATQLRSGETFGPDVWFVDLSIVRDPANVPATIARTLRVSHSGVADPAKALEGFLASRRGLLVLDNFEHVLPAAAGVARLLAGVEGLTVLVTSREPLRLRWERTIPVQPLALPDPRHLLPPDRLATVPAVALFLDRAAASAAGFELTEGNAAPIASLCVRLDGLPLAIELAAARAAQLGVAATLDRLDRRLPLPSSIIRDAPERQRSLRATFQWSLDLLPEAEQVLFQRLAVFAGGWTIPAAQSVSGEAGGDVLDAMFSLADKSLVVVHPATTLDEARFRMLETAREVARDLLADSGEEVEARRLHARYFAGLAEELAAGLKGAEQASIAARLELEEDNFRHALDWLVMDRGADGLEIGLRLTGALGWYWFLHGYPPEARAWFAMLLEPSSALIADAASDADRVRLLALRARALNAAGFRATDQAEYELASAAHHQAHGIWLELGDTPGLVASLHGIGDTALWLGRTADARAKYLDGLALAGERGTGEDVAMFGFHLAQLSWLVDELDAGEAYGLTALDTGRAAGSTTWPPYCLFVLASIAHERGDVSTAGALYRDALQRGWQHRDRLCVRMALPGLAGLATLEGDPARSMRLAGAANALEETAGIWAFPPIRARHERWLAAARDALDEVGQADAWAEGRAMSLDEVVAYAIEPAEPHGLPRATRKAPRGSLSAREREVLALVATGSSNRQIAETLVVTEHTAKYHVTSLLNKLGASNRAEAVARAASLGLIQPEAN